MSVFIRIALRYVASALVIKGLLSPDDSAMITEDPELAAAIEVGIGFAIGAIAEGWYALARRFGWAK